ncbi:MAG: ammonium transporter [Candidatus Nealsonbacteria bacterium]|nr:ammonium transporter [Candidatus Nealsonbacteria bacterium]
MACSCRFLVLGLFSAAIWSACTSGVLADEPSPTTEPIAEAAAETPEEVSRGDNAWMLTCSALVLFMTAPGLALFYSGLVRKKNVVGVMMQCVFLMALMTVVWALWGYSLAFGGSNPWIGNTEFLAMDHVQSQWVDGHPQVPMTGGGIPVLTHMLFQGMFFIITPALICGAFAERMKFSTMVVFMVLWGTLVYCPLCHWVWDGGILAFGKPCASISAGGALDFAGGTVVHISSGVSALICALVIGKRLGFGQEPMPPHNLTYTAMGAAMLWVGWFGFNAGSQLSADGVAASAFAVTHFGAAAGALGWAAMEWITRGKPSILGTCSGLVAGLVCVTPAAGFVQPTSGLIMGLAAGIFCFYTCTTMKRVFGYDDSLDAFGIHGMGGTLGAILTGVFATRAVTDMADGSPLGLIENGTVIFGQIAATAITWVVAGVATFMLLKILDATMGLRVSEVDEVRGLDLSQHGEEGYIYI